MSARSDGGVLGDYTSAAGAGGPGKSERAAVVSRARRRLDQEKVKCMQRYEAREQRVIKTLNYCMTALERLEGWAVFAIFPTDEKQKGNSSYCTFVEQRFRCITVQLQGFVDALKRREQQPTVQAATVEYASCGRPSPVGVAPGELRLNLGGSPTHALDRSQSHTVASPLYIDDDFDEDDDGLDVGPLQQPQQQQPACSAQSLPLRTQVASMAKQFVDDGRSVRRSVLEHLHRCRRDLHTVLQWGVKSLDELRDVIDETMADELACMVREKMLRVLAYVTDFEEAADQFERSMSDHAATTPTAAEYDDEVQPAGVVQGPSAPGADSSDVIPQRLSAERHVGKSREYQQQQVDTAGHSPPTVDRLVLQDDDDETAARRDRETSTGSAVTSSDDWLGFYSRHHSHSAAVHDSRRSGAASAPLPPSDASRDDRRSSWTDDEDDGLSTVRSDGSTPEPPLSARPKSLDNHPKILKDQLHRSQASLGGSHDVKFFNRSWTFAGR